MNQASQTPVADMKRSVLAFLMLVVQAQLAPSALAQMEEPEPWLSLENLVVAVASVFLTVTVMLAARRFRGGRNERATQAQAKIEEAPGSEPPAQQQPATTATPREGRLVFISYRRNDSADITGRIYDRLIEHFGKGSVFKDVDSIPLGLDFRKHLEGAVAECSVTLAVIGGRWLDAKTASGERRLGDSRDRLRIEIEAALKRDIPLIPVLVQGASLPPEKELPSSLQPLAFRNGIGVRPDPDFHGDVDRLIRGIETHCTNRIAE